MVSLRAWYRYGASCRLSDMYRLAGSHRRKCRACTDSVFPCFSNMSAAKIPPISGSGYASVRYCLTARQLVRVTPLDFAARFSCVDIFSSTISPQNCRGRETRCIRIAASSSQSEIEASGPGANALNNKSVLPKNWRGMARRGSTLPSESSVSIFAAIGGLHVTFLSFADVAAVGRCCFDAGLTVPVLVWA